MSTPTFNSAATSFTTVRLYTELDPYYYTIDNRPLQDLQTNTTGLSSAADAGRLGTLIEALGLSSVLSGLYTTTATQVSGLRASATSISTITVAPGAMIYPAAISAGITNQVTRIAASPSAVTLNTPAPVTLGQEMTYLVQIQANDFSGTSVYPNFDSTNPFLQSTLFNGYLNINVIAGAQASIGFSVAPTVTPGFLPLYTVVSAAGSPLPVLTIASSAPPRLNGLSYEEQWITPTLTNSWVNLGGYQPFQYKRSGTRIMVRGSISGGTAAAAAFTFPAGFRPLTTSGYVASNGTTGVNFVTVNAAGALIPSVSSATHLGLIEFTTD